MPLRTLAGRALGLLLVLLSAGAGLALIYSQFAVGWSGGRVNDGVTVGGIALVTYATVGLACWLTTTLRAGR